MKQCPNCSNYDVLSVHKSEGVPTYQNVVLESLQEAMSVPRGIIEFFFCNECTFLYNAAFDENLVGYGASYENDQTYSAIFTQHIAHIAKNIIDKNKITHHNILEIGCGTGYFLKKIVSESNGNTGVGFDKSLQSTSVSDKISLYNKYYEDGDMGNFDIVLSRHVIEHIMDNNILFTTLVQKNPNAKFFIETPSLEWIIEKNTFYDVFYEHCSYFSYYSISKLLSNHGLSIVKAESVFNGQYMWIEAVTDKPPQSITKTLNATKIKDFFLKTTTMKNEVQNRLSHAMKSEKGEVAIWGAGAKGLTFANMVDPQRQYINCIIDINPRKQKKFCAGTGHPIVCPTYVRENNVKTILIMNENYAKEIMGMFPENDINFISIEREV